MRRLSGKFYLCQRQENLPLYKETQIQETIRRSEQAFCEHEAEQFLSAPEFLYLQSGYIHKRWWFLQGLLLSIIWLSMKYAGNGPHIQRSMGILVPIFALLIMPELWKNRMTGSTEIECTTLYSLRQMYAARMLLFALADLLLISVFLTVVSVTLQIRTADLMIQFFIPFNVTCCICFRSLYSRQSSSEICALFLCMFWSTVWTKIALTDRIYDAVTLPVWSALFLGSVLWLYYCVRKVWKDCEKTPLHRHQT